METPPFPPHHPHPPPPPNLASTLAHLRSLLSAANSAVAALPFPLLAPPASTSLATIPSPPPTTPLPPPASAVTLPLPLAPAPYSDCPAVVRTTPTPVPDSCSLPAFLAAECADFSSSSSPGTTAAAASQNPRPFRVLPSELGLLRRELDFWGAGAPHLPGSYSYSAARVAAAFRFGVTPWWEAELRRWVLASSPRYGVIIDAAVQDHIWLLVLLCLKAAATEAQCFLDQMGKGVDHVGLGFDPRAVRFECPRFAEGFSWLGAQLGILYGEGNGRLFAVAAAKEAVLRMGYCLTITVSGVRDGFCVSGNGQAGAGGGADEKGSDAPDVMRGPVSLSQVAAAIAALYERFTMEEKIKALQAPRPPKYHLLFEYSKALEQGHLERSNRPHYRAVMEYDGILSRRVDNQESGKAKTKEELLAEERDYKRRRQSYRGKKVKRNPAEILRDIIDEHMEEIKQAGGIGCLVAAPEEVAQSMLNSNSHEGPYQGSFDPTSSSSYDKTALGSRSSSCENSQHANSSGRVSSRSHGKRDSNKNLRYETHVNRCHNLSDHENRWVKESESKIDQSYANHRESKRHRRNSNNDREYAYKHKKDVSEDSDYHLQSSGYTARSIRSQRSSVTDYDHMLGGHSDRSRTSQKRYKSVSVTQEQFSDRYDPQSTYSDEDPPTCMLYDITEGKSDVMPIAKGK